MILLLNHALVVEMVLNVSKRRTRLKNLLSGWKCNVRSALDFNVLSRGVLRNRRSA